MKGIIRFLLALSLVLFIPSFAFSNDSIVSTRFDLNSANLRVGYGNAFDLGGTKKGNLSDTEFIVLGMGLEYIVADFNLTDYFSGHATGELGIEIIGINPPIGTGSFVYSRLHLDFSGMDFYIPSTNLRIRPLGIFGAGIGNIDIGHQWDKQRDGFNFMLFTGAGLQLDDEVALLYEFHHISNASTRDPNNGVNSNVFLLEFNFRGI